MILGTVPLFQGMTAWFVVLENQFGWSRTQLSGAFALTRVEGSIMGPIGGYLIDRIGPRWMVLIGLLILGIVFLLWSRISNLWQFYLVFIVMSAGAGLGTWLPMMTVLNNWFNRRRSTAMALAMEGFSVGGVLLIPILTWAIDPEFSNRPGWRATAAGIGLLVVVLAYPISRLIRNKPEDYGQHPDGSTPLRVTAGVREAPESAAPEFDYTWQAAIRTRSFWLITMGHACSSTVIVTLMVHLGPMLDDRGFSLQMVGWVVSTYTAVGAVFTLVGGFVGDRMPIRVAIFGFSAVQSIAVFVLLFADSNFLLFLFAVILGIGFGGRNPLTTAIRGAYFGRKAFASITGISMVPMNVLLLASPLFAGIMFDIQGTYVVPFTVVAVVSLIGSALFLPLGAPEVPSATEGVAARRKSLDRQ